MRLRCTAVDALLLLISAVPGWSEEVLWYDGTLSPPPPGRLLSDNDGYWGDSILTGVEYTYERTPDNPADVWRDRPEKFGRRLLDGRPAGNWWTPVGITGPLVVTFDFKRICTFQEVDLDTRNRRVAVRLEVATTPSGPWETALERSRADCPDRQLHRLPLPNGPTGRCLRLTVEAEGITWLEEVLVWGEAEVTPEVPESIQPLVPPPPASEIAFQSFPGIDKTAFSDGLFWEWQRSLGPAAKQPAVWSEVPTWDSITDRPLLPTPASRRREVVISMARNETECVALALTNVSWEKPWETVISLSPFRAARGGEASGLAGQVWVAGTIGSRHYGVNVGPLFAADNLLPPGLMQRYLTNGASIQAFPQLILPPAGSAVLWLSVTTAQARPGEYRARLSCRGGPSVWLRVQVRDVTLPQPRIWLQTYSSITSMFPFVYADRAAREVAYKESLGVTVWNGFPEEGTLAQRAHRPGRTFFHIWGIGDYGHRLYGGGIDPAKLTAEDEQKIAELIRGHVDKARSLGLDYDDWYVELTDEPGQGNSPAFGALARLIRKADPRVRIYCNPSFWVGNGCLPDEPVYEALHPWYNDCVDVSCPLYLLLQDRPRCLTLFDAPRLVRAFYYVSTQSAKSERSAQVELYRQMAWEAFRRGWNGWGFYSYFAPRGNPWNDFDAEWYTGEDLPDYQMVYPGPRGPIPTRQSEALREGWEDYCLLTLLQNQGKKREVQALLADYDAGKPLAQLRRQALEIACW